MFPNRSRNREHLASIFTRLAQVAFTQVIFFSPLRAAFIVLKHPTPNVFSLYTDLCFYLSDIPLLLTLGFWVLSLLLSPRPVKSGPRFLALPIFGLVALSWVGVPTGVDPLLSAYQSLRLSLLLALYLFLVNENIPPRWIAEVFAFGIVFEAGIGLAQFIAQRSLHLDWLGELALDPRWTGTSIVRLGAVRVLRAYGLTEHPNVLGGFLAFGMVLLLGYYLSMRVSRSSREKYAWLLPLACGAIGILLTFSRAAALAFSAGFALLGLVLLVHAPARARYLRDLVLAGAFVLVVLAPLTFAAQPLLVQRTGQNASFDDNSSEQRSLAERSALLASAGRLFYRHPLVGVGNGALPVAMYGEDGPFDKHYAYEPAHVVLAEVAAELGFPGGVLWLWLMVIPWLALALKWREVASSPWLLGVSAALFVVTIIGLFDYYPWLLEPGRLWQWSAWGLLGGVYESTVQSGRALR